MIYRRKKEITKSGRIARNKNTKAKKELEYVRRKPSILRVFFFV